MKKINKQILKLGSLFFVVLILTGCTTTIQNNTNNSGSGNKIASDTARNRDIINKGGGLVDDDVIILNSNEINGLILMREEEKLARDVYLVLYEKYDLRIFNNIASSEQTHMDAVKVLLDRYNIIDPIVDGSTGLFISQELLDLYDNLIEVGSESLLDALIVGATIEDLDIKDLNLLLSETDNENIINTYNNLNNGSKKHLNSYIKQIEFNGGVYSPQYISQEEFDKIVK